MATDKAAVETEVATGDAEEVFHECSTSTDFTSSAVAENDVYCAADGLPSHFADLPSEMFVDAKQDDDGTFLDLNEDKDARWFVDEETLSNEELSAEVIEERSQRGASLKDEGNGLFGAADFAKAAEKYTTALNVYPKAKATERSVLYANRSACFIKMERRDLALTDCNSAVLLNPQYEKALMRRAQLYDSSEDTYEKALEDYQAVLKLNARNRIALDACQRLPCQINDRNEKLKREMIGKFKDLGNIFLRPFGLSTDNFKMEPNSEGGYSLKMEK